MKAIGIDIGTTTICGVLADSENGRILESRTLKNQAKLSGGREYERLQEPDKIAKLCRGVIDEFLENYGEIGSIGITGQMHGILYLDREGNPVTPLITWQDGRGNLMGKDGVSWAEKLTRDSGYQLASGFGIVSHACLREASEIPENASVFCGIPDYVAMVLGGRKEPLVHESMAASFGMFDVEQGRYDEEAMKKCGICTTYLPKLGKEKEILGLYKGIPVCLGIGDNQASFLGTIEGQEKVLVNIGTGGQISVKGNVFRTFPTLECRPYIEKKFLYVGASLCGGYAYELLKNFFEETIKLFGTPREEEIYEKMNQAGMDAKRRGRGRLKIDTRFRGSRKEPDSSGSIQGIREGLLSPGSLALGVLEGISRELYGFYEELPRDIRMDTRFAASGNGVKKNFLLQQLLEEAFQMKMRLSQNNEEASYGAALFSIYVCGQYRSTEWMKREFQEKRQVTAPIFFERNRVKRVYKGGALFKNFFGNSEGDNYYPEEWAASSVEAFKEEGDNLKEGISIAEETGIPLNELLKKYPDEILGKRKEMGILVKILDSAVRLPVQVHPDQEFSRRYLKSSHGKTELWYVLDTRKDAAVYFGFREGISRREFEETIERSKEDKGAMEGLLNRIPVKKGEVYLIPSRAVHAIGKGCLILEIQEPTDFTIQPEYWCGEYPLSEREMYLGLSKETALSCFDFSIYGKEACQKISKKQPWLYQETETYKTWKFLKGEEGSCFDVELWELKKGTAFLTGGACIYVILDGEGSICGERSVCGEGYQRKVKKGDYFLLPDRAKGNYWIKTNGDLSYMVCIPPQEEL